MVGNNREKRNRIERHVEQMAFEWLDKYDGAFAANPGIKTIDILQPEPKSLWFQYALISETRRLRWLTVVLIVLTAVLAILTTELVLLR